MYNVYIYIVPNTSHNFFWLPKIWDLLIRVATITR